MKSTTPAVDPFAGYRAPASVDEMAKWCSDHSHIEAKCAQGTRVIRLKVNGAVRRWKRDRERIAVPVKYGMYEYGTFDKSDMFRILIPKD